MVSGVRAGSIGLRLILGTALGGGGLAGSLDLGGEGSLSGGVGSSLGSCGSFSMPVGGLESNSDVVADHLGVGAFELTVVEDLGLGCWTALG